MFFLTPEIILQAIINGILLGGLYVLLSIGLNLITGVLKIINFAHGEIIMLSMYITFWLSLILGFNPFELVIPISILMGLIGILTYIILIKPSLASSDIEMLMITAGLSMFMQGLAQVLWKSDYRILKVYAGAIALGGIYISIPLLIASIISFVTSLGLYLFLMKSVRGAMIRSVAQDREMSSLLGIDTEKIYYLVTFLSFMTAGIAGVLLISMFPTYPTAGVIYGLLAWLIMVIGGLGSVIGSFIGGIIVGITESLIATFYNVELARAFIFIIFVIIIALRPSGLLGARARV
jgi:branched-chain amino acid transport system permease protein